MRILFPRRLLAGLIATATLLLAQTAPRPLTHDDYDTWRNIATPQLSRDGRWLAYAWMPQEADGELVVREVATSREHRVPVGALPPPALPSPDENPNPEAPPPVRNIRIAFTSDGAFAVASTYPTKADATAARRAKKKPEEMPKGGLVVVRLADGEVTRVADVKSFQVPGKGGAWLAYLKEAKPEEKKPEAKAGEEAKAETKTATPEEDAEAATGSAGRSAQEDGGEEAGDQARRGGAAGAGGGAAAGAPGERTFGTELVLRDLAAGAERSFASVSDYSLARDGKALLYTVSAKTETENGVYVATPGDAAAPRGLLTGKGRYSRLTWDREQAQVAFVSDHDAVATGGAGAAGAATGSAAAGGGASRGAPRHKLYHWPRGAAAAEPVVSAATKGWPAKFAVSSTASPAFSRDGKKLYVGAGLAARGGRGGGGAGGAPAGGSGAAAAAGGAAAADEDKVTADLWHWRDGHVQPMQKVRVNQDRNRTYRGVFDFAARTYVQLGDEELATISLSDDGTRAIGTDDRAYRHLGDFDGRFADVHVVDATTGARKVALTKLRSEGGSVTLWSPDGKHAAYYQGKQWHLLDTATGATRSLTAGMRVALHNEDDDRPAPPSPYGAAGWTKDSASFLVYDRFDVWQVFVDGRAPRNLTAGHGRATKVQLRVQRIEPVDEEDDERGIDPAKPLVLRGESEETRATGFFRTAFGAEKPAAPVRLLWGDERYTYVGRAQEADALLLTVARFDRYPDVHVTDSSMATLKKLTDGDAQRAAFAWGRSELMAFRSTDGTPLKAALYLPANFDPKKKYPLMVYIYERLAQTVHGFVNPSPGTSINASFYTSNGYIVLMPDIVYKKGEPGESAMRCVLPAVDAAVARGFVDEKAIGIQGHSWGGYQIAYMLTRTDRFRAAEAGAPVGNMTSAYSGIRWGSGMPRQFQYETGQSRIGGSLQAETKKYLANSPIFHIERVTTPLLIMANDNDDAVPWYQGIELFLALRRHGKAAWLFNYNGEFHGLRRRVNQKDWAKRMSGFFDHYLKGAPAPEWLEKGVPYLERDEEKVKFNAPAKATAEAKPAAEKTGGDAGEAARKGAP